MGYRVVWFKRDLRVHDHAALAAAAAHGPVLCLLVLEPGFWREPDASARHFGFMRESWLALDADLRRIGLRLQVVVGDMPAVLQRLWACQPFDALHAHQETGNAFTYRRDQAVARWCSSHGVPWHQHPASGVVRGLRSRDGWQERWEAHMAAPLVALPGHAENQPLPWPEPTPADPPWPGLRGGDAPARQRGGRPAALAVLQSFLETRSERYRGGISSPLTAPDACSRLSPYLAWGCLSLREVVQATRRTAADLPPDERPQRLGLQAFLSRLSWHCHFIQKLESEPAIEWRNLHPGYDGLREPGFNPAHFDRLREGSTGWPLVDASVAMLRETGWINFRMRAMLVAVAAYPLWLHWRPVGLWLAQQFLDYEPGIHWSQMQMQSGTTGINTTRIYNPLKQARDHDPGGHFVRRWLPAMRRVPDAWLFEPWRMPASVQTACGVRVGADIPLPPVDLGVATRQARDRLYAVRTRPDVKAAEAAIVARHGSRHRSAEQTGRVRPAAGQAGLGGQGSLF